MTKSLDVPLDAVRIGGKMTVPAKMAVALQVFTADQLQEVAKSLHVPLDAVRIGDRMVVPAKWKVVLRCIREAAGVDARMVAALGNATVERLYRRVARKPIMQQLVDAIYPRNNVIVQSPSTADQPRAHSPRRTADRQASRMQITRPGKGWQRCTDKLRSWAPCAKALIDIGSVVLAQAGEAYAALQVLADLPTDRDLRDLLVCLTSYSGEQLQSILADWKQAASPEVLRIRADRRAAQREQEQQSNPGANRQ